MRLPITEGATRFWICWLPYRWDKELDPEIYDVNQNSFDLIEILIEMKKYDRKKEVPQYAKNENCLHIGACNK